VSSPLDSTSRIIRDAAPSLFCTPVIYSTQPVAHFSWTAKLGGTFTFCQTQNLKSNAAVLLVGAKPMFAKLTMLKSFLFAVALSFALLLRLAEGSHLDSNEQLELAELNFGRELYRARQSYGAWRSSCPSVPDYESLFDQAAHKYDRAIYRFEMKYFCALFQHLYLAVDFVDKAAQAAYALIPDDFDIGRDECDFPEIAKYFFCWDEALVAANTTKKLGVKFLTDLLEIFLRYPGIDYGVYLEAREKLNEAKSLEKCCAGPYAPVAKKIKEGVCFVYDAINSTPATRRALRSGRK